MKRVFRLAGLAILAFAGFVFLNNTSLFPDPQPGRPTLTAHRGMAQDFDRRGLDAETCTASRMLPPRHGFLENTIPSIGAAFERGADIVEIDIQPTLDGRFAVFHDWTLDCRTDGSGVTREHTLAELQGLDVGYGYTADGGRTFPFRGRGIRLMPSLDEVLDAFPGRRFLLNVKSNDPEEGRAVAAYLARLPAERRALLAVYGGDRPIAELRQALPSVPVTSKEIEKSCLLSYLAIGWSGHVPAACRRIVFLVPINVAPWLWGWPYRLVERMESAGSSLSVIGHYRGGAFSEGLNEPTDIARLPAGYLGGISTDRVDLFTVR